MAAAIGTVERVSNLLVQGVHVGVGGCSHLHPHLYHLTWDDCRRCAVVVRLGATHDPKRKKVAFGCCCCCCAALLASRITGWGGGGDLESDA